MPKETVEEAEKRYIKAQEELEKAQQKLTFYTEKVKTLTQEVSLKEVAFITAMRVENNLSLEDLKDLLLAPQTDTGGQ